MNPCTLWMDAAAGHIVFATLTVAWTLWLAVWAAQRLTQWLTDRLMEHLFGECLPRREQSLVLRLDIAEMRR